MVSLSVIDVHDVLVLSHYWLWKRTSSTEEAKGEAKADKPFFKLLLWLKILLMEF
jgi:hypothetical protein